MGKYNYLLKNIGVLTISNFGTKFLSLILIPLYTRVLSTTEYGTYDVYFTTVSLLIPILTLNIIEALMRFLLDKKQKKSMIFSIGLKRVIISCILVIVFVLCNYYYKFIELFNMFPVYFVLLFIGSIIYDLLSQFSRGIERVSCLAFAGALNSITMLGLNVFLLIYVKMGLEGYFIANCFAYFIPSIYLFFKLKVWKYITSETDQILKKNMFNYSKPLVFNTIAWWINNVSDRYIVTWLCGVAANGVYSVAYKVPSILNVFQSIFNQAWTLSAVKEFDENSSKFYSDIYEIYNCGMVIVCSSLIAAVKIMANILFAKDFFIAWQYAPFLMLSVVFGAISGLLGGIFSAAKQSKIFAQTTIVGAVLNIVLNIVLIDYIGVVGAAISTLVSYFLVWILRYRAANRIVVLDIDIKNNLIVYFLLFAQCCIWSVSANEVLIYFIQILIVCIIINLNKNDIFRLYNKLSWKFKSR